MLSWDMMPFANGNLRLDRGLGMSSPVHCTNMRRKCYMTPWFPMMSIKSHTVELWPVLWKVKQSNSAVWRNNNQCESCITKDD